MRQASLLRVAKFLKLRKLLVSIGTPLWEGASIKKLIKEELH